MRKWIFYILIFLYLVPSTQLSQLFKIPIFITHLEEHNEGRGFFSELKIFIIHHYGGHEVDDDWETDQKLPFIKSELVHLIISNIPEKNISVPLFKKQYYTEPISFFNDSKDYSHYLSTIWQPPKHS